MHKHLHADTSQLAQDLWICLQWCNLLSHCWCLRERVSNPCRQFKNVAARFTLSLSASQFEQVLSGHAYLHIELPALAQIRQQNRQSQAWLLLYDRMQYSSGPDCKLSAAEICPWRHNLKRADRQARCMQQFDTANLHPVVDVFIQVYNEAGMVTMSLATGISHLTCRSKHL